VQEIAFSENRRTGELGNEQNSSGAGCGRPKSDHPAFVAHASSFWYGSSTAGCAQPFLFVLGTLFFFFFFFSSLSARGLNFGDSSNTINYLPHHHTSA
jgi:hypothetical protein